MSENHSLGKLFKQYSKQMLLDNIGRDGQYKLVTSKVLIVGAGGIGATLIPYLAGAGIGHLRIIDNDVIDVGNLHRQILYDTTHI